MIHDQEIELTHLRNQTIEDYRKQIQEYDEMLNSHIQSSAIVINNVRADLEMIKRNVRDNLIWIKNLASNPKTDIGCSNVIDYCNSLLEKLSNEQKR